MATIIYGARSSSCINAPSSSAWCRSRWERLSFLVGAPAQRITIDTDIVRSADYVQGQKRIEKISNHREHVHNNDWVGAGSYNIFAGVFVATIFGAAFFFDLFWPEREETKAVRLSWKICGVLATIFHLASALTLTVITVRHSAYITPGDRDRQDFWWSKYEKHEQNPLSYRHNPRALAAVVFAWLGFVSVVGRYACSNYVYSRSFTDKDFSCILLFFGLNHIEKGLGPKSTHARVRDAEKAPHSDFESEGKCSGESVQCPDPARLSRAQVDGASQEPPAAEHSTFAEGQR